MHFVFDSVLTIMATLTAASVNYTEANITVSAAPVPAIMIAEAQKTDILLKPAAVNVKQAKANCDLPSFSVFNEDDITIANAAIKNIPCYLLRNLTKISFYDDKDLPRAMAGATSLQIRNDALKAPEARQLLIHELGHVVDLGGLRGNAVSGASNFKDGHQQIWQDDVSLIFYRISWQNQNTWQKNTGKQDFVTGYAATDVFEDFAESFLLYLENARYFRQLAQKNSKIAAKYNFFRDHLFGGIEFATGVTDPHPHKRYWDATRL